LEGTNVTPFGKGRGSGKDHCPTFVPSVNQLEEQIATVGGDRQITDIVDIEQSRAAQLSLPFPEPAFPFGIGKGGRPI
jgi:hypothetical protein